MSKRAILLIMDGYGIGEYSSNNAIRTAETPNIDKFFTENPTTSLVASGTDVGLPKGVMGNSEVGHLNIGAGRVVYQMNTLIDKMISTGDFFFNEALNNAIKHTKENNSNLHLFGLVSDGNVHSNLKHLNAILELAEQKDVENLYLHAFTDGRDTSPHGGIDYIKDVQKKMESLQTGKIATITGRYYAMDRDNRWERVQKGYNAIANGEGEFFDDPVEAVKSSYNEKITDEFILPKVITEDGKPIATIQDNDAILFFNFRADRAREITRTFIYPDFSEFETKKFSNLKYVTFTEYDKSFGDRVEVAFYKQHLDNILGEIVANNDLKQLRLAETEKYAHVTFFFNGSVEKPFKNEDRILVASPKVASYDMKPQMSAYEVLEIAEEKINEKTYDLIIINLANCDMVGHTGDLDATVKAVETVDHCVGKIAKAAEIRDYNLLITADHGNAEKMQDENGKPFTAHTTNRVPLSIRLSNGDIDNLKTGKLADIAPTILKIMEIKQPLEMTGVSLF